MAGALQSVIKKLADLAAGEYNLQKGLKGEIKFLQLELESIQGALEDISKVPADQLPNGDKIWARNVREMSYDIEDSIDKFMVRCKGGNEMMTKQHGSTSKTAIDRCLDLLMQPMIRHKIATEIRGVKSRVMEVHKLHMRYRIDTVPNPAASTIDPRLYAQGMKTSDLVGIDEARDELIETIIEGNEVSLQQGKIVSIVGFGGLGKTTLANAVYEKLRARFDCCAFVSVSQTPLLKKIFKDLLNDLGQSISDETLDEEQLIKVLREFLKEKRYFIVIDDIWDIPAWKIIKRALPDNDDGYTIITTTRNCDVADQVGGVYKMKYLSLSNSRKLFYRRIFGNENKYNNEDPEKCPHEELVEISTKLIGKCAGVPLAIITMASLLASKARNKMDWYEVYNSIGTGLENSFDVENMRKILLLSYYDLPPHLKTCLLYLSVFPEDFDIEKDRLIWMWIAEGFVQCKKQGESLFELGECYFNELKNRSMIQLVIHGLCDISEHCRVHDMVLELIRFLSSEENFITILNDDMDRASPLKTIRRLSLQNCKEDHSDLQANISKKKIRSVILFLPGNDPKLDLGSFRVLRVLDLQSCDLSNARSLKYLGKLIHLRYLGLRNTGIRQLPEEIRNLQYLLTLDWRRNSNDQETAFQLAVFQLKHLRCLHIHHSGGVPNGISKLTFLEVLTIYFICDSTTIIELGNLTELRVVTIGLDIRFADRTEKSMAESLVETLQKLKKVKSVDIVVRTEMEGTHRFDAWRAPPHLRQIKMPQCWFSARPDWMNPSHLQNLCCLFVDMDELQQQDLEILGRFRALRYLCIRVKHDELGIRRTLVVGTSSFPSLAWCCLMCFVPPVVFRSGAMPRLAHLAFTFPVLPCGSIRGFELGLGNLTSLQYVQVVLQKDGGSMEEEARSVLRRAAEIHPNHPILEIF